MLKFKDCGTMYKLLWTGSKALACVMRWSTVNESNRYTCVNPSVGLALLSWWARHFQARELICPGQLQPFLRRGYTHLHLRFHGPDVSLVLDANFPEFRLDCVLLDSMSLQIKM